MHVCIQFISVSNASYNLLKKEQFKHFVSFLPLKMKYECQVVHCVVKYM